MSRISVLTILAISILPHFSLSFSPHSKCPKILKDGGFSDSYFLSIAHVIHSITHEELQKFDGEIPERNFVPTQTRDLDASTPTTRHAPHETASEFQSQGLKVLDQVLQTADIPGYLIYRNAEPLNRLVHAFHMIAMWDKARSIFVSKVLTKPPNSRVCACLNDVEGNGIMASLENLFYYVGGGNNTKRNTHRDSKHQVYVQKDAICLGPWNERAECNPDFRSWSARNTGERKETFKQPYRGGKVEVWPNGDVHLRSALSWEYMKEFILGPVPADFEQYRMNHWEAAVFIYCATERAKREAGVGGRPGEGYRG